MATSKLCTTLQLPLLSFSEEQDSCLNKIKMLVIIYNRKIGAEDATLLIFYRLCSSLGGSKFKVGAFEEHKHQILANKHKKFIKKKQCKILIVKKKFVSIEKGKIAADNRGQLA